MKTSYHSFLGGILIIEQKRQFLYQSGPTSSVILWSWTFVILLLGITLGLELPTNLQWIPYTIGGIFLILSWMQVHFRHIYVEHDTIRVSRVMNHNWVNIRLKDIENVHVSKYRLGFVYGGKIYQFILPVNSAIELNQLIKTHQQDNAIHN